MNMRVECLLAVGAEQEEEAEVHNARSLYIVLVHKLVSIRIQDVAVVLVEEEEAEAEDVA